MQRHEGYCRLAAAVPVVVPADVTANVEQLIALAHQAAAENTDVVTFPELCVTGYSCADLFFQQTLLDAAEEGLAQFLRQTRTLSPLLIVGLPLRVEGLLFNCAVVCCGGVVMGVVPKCFLPNTREFYEQRWFVSATGTQAQTARVCGQEVPFGLNVLFATHGATKQTELLVGVELCEDLWSPLPPSVNLALQGATVLCNLSASNELVGKVAYRQTLVTHQSARCLAAYVYAGAGPGESTTDLVFGGHTLIAENGNLLSEGTRFARHAQLLLADVDLHFLAFERRQNSAFQSCVSTSTPCRRIACMRPDALVTDGPLLRPLAAMPFVPVDVAGRDARCAEVFAIQATGLATRLIHAGFQRVVVGLSGGLDSTLALLATCEAFDRAKLDRAGILALTMPGFGTTQRTLGNARSLCQALGVTLEEITIHEACRTHLRDLGHDGTSCDVTYENAQARERTQLLMDRANMLGALVVGTGDLSEIALGWSTYNGDHMSMYGINGGVPKTLVRELVSWVAREEMSRPDAAVLEDILKTPVSPELLPADKNDGIAQKTEEVIGPYALHDFFLFHTVRRGTSPQRLRVLAEQAFEGVYTTSEISKWLNLFLKRFFSQQFKRSCLPDGPKVGAINLSPRGDWRMPSDASVACWLSAH